MVLTLPPTFPELGKYRRYNWNLSSFAIYTLVETSKESLHDIAFQLQGDWWGEEGNGGHSLVRVAPDFDYQGRSLRDVIQAHISLLERDTQHVRSYAEFNDGDVDWFPTAFGVVTSKADMQERSPLFVYADPYDEPTRCPLDKFHFRVGDGRSMLSSIRLGDTVCPDAKEMYAIST